MADFVPYRVYIPTRNRLKNVERVVPGWLAQDFDVVLVTDPREKQLHLRFVAEKFGLARMTRNMNDHTPGVTVIAPGQSNMGFGYQCDFAARHAADEHVLTFVLSDDDLMPIECKSVGPKDCTCGYMQLLVDELANRPDYLGMGAVRDYHDLMTRNLPNGPVSKHSGVVLCPAGWGQQCYAINTRKLFALGGFDKRLTCFGEGHDLIRKSIVRGKRPWLVHAGVKVKAIGKRYEPGGLDTYAAEVQRHHDRLGIGNYRNMPTAEVRTLLENDCKAIIHKDWPRYTTATGRVMWKKMLDENIPFWTAQSALHGGDQEI